MSIASEITRLQNIKTAIRNALVNKGIAAAANHDMADFASDIAAIPTGGTPTGTIYITQNGTHNVASYASADVNVSASVSTQEKSCSPSTSQQEITPDTGYYLSKVTVGAALLETKTVTPGPSQIIITPTSGYYGLSQVTVNPATGSLIVVSYTSPITTVLAVANSVTYYAYMDTANNKAYITIPHTYQSGVVYIYGYAGTTFTASTNVTLNGIDKYTCSLLSSSIVYDSGSWNGITPSWYTYPGASPITVTEYTNKIGFVPVSLTDWCYEYLSPAVSRGSYNSIKITVENSNVLAFGAVNSVGNTPSMTFLSNGVNTISVSSLNSSIYLVFAGLSTSTAGYVTKIEFA